MKNTTIRGEKSWNIPEAVETMARGREHPVVWAGDGAHQGTHIHEPQEGQTAQAGVWQDENSILKKKKTQNHDQKKKNPAKFWSFATCFRLPQLTQVNLDVLKLGSLILTV